MSPFERDMKSQRAQTLEDISDNFQKIIPAEVADSDDANRLKQAACYFSVAINRVDSMFPSEEDEGVVAAMGTEDTNACGLLVDQDGHRRFEYEPTIIPEVKLNMYGPKAVTGVAAGGMHSACLHRDGTVSTWGANDERALGRGEIDDDEVHKIKPMLNIKDAIQISAGDNHTVVLDINGKVHTAGMYKDTDSGMFRDLRSSDDLEICVKENKHHNFPVTVQGLKKIVYVDAGSSWNAALDENGDLYTWGMGNSGELSRSKSMGAKLVQASYIDSDGKDQGKYDTYDVTKKFTGDYVEKEETKNGKKETYTVYNYNHRIIRDKYLTPAPVEWVGGLKRQVEHFSCGMLHLLVVARDPGSFETQVFSAGNSGYGQLGNGGTKDCHELTPIKALKHKGISKVAAGNYHSLALSMCGKSVFAWGKIDEGALGLYDDDKTKTFSSCDFVGTPEQIVFPDTLGNSCLVDIAAGDTTSFAITDAGAVYSWGYNENSQAGHYNSGGDSPLITRPRLLDVMAAINEKAAKALAKNCRVIHVSGGGQHSLMVVKRYR